MIKMGKVKPIEQLAEDVRKGDLVRIQLIGDNAYTGFYDRKVVYGTKDVRCSFKSRLKYDSNFHSVTLYMIDKKLSNLSPSKRRCTALSYEILGRAKKSSD